MVDLQRNLTIPIKTPITDQGGNITRPWLQFFLALIQAVLGADEAITSAGITLEPAYVRGAAQLNDAGAIPQVTLPGVLSESSIADTGSAIKYGANTGETGPLTISYVASATLNNPSPGVYTLSTTTKTITFNAGLETGHT